MGISPILDTALFIPIIIFITVFKFGFPKWIIFFWTSLSWLTFTFFIFPKSNSKFSPSLIPCLFLDFILSGKILFIKSPKLVINSSINDWKLFLLVKIKVLSISYPYFFNWLANFSSFIFEKGFKKWNFFFLFSMTSTMLLLLVLFFFLYFLFILTLLLSFFAFLILYELFLISLTIILLKELSNPSFSKELPLKSKVVSFKSSSFFWSLKLLLFFILLNWVIKDWVLLNNDGTNAFLQLGILLHIVLFALPLLILLPSTMLSGRENMT